MMVPILLLIIIILIFKFIFGFLKSFIGFFTQDQGRKEIVIPYILCNCILLPPFGDIFLSHRKYNNLYIIIIITH